MWEDIVTASLEKYLLIFTHFFNHSSASLQKTSPSLASKKRETCHDQPVINVNFLSTYLKQQKVKMRALLGCLRAVEVSQEFNTKDLTKRKSSQLRYVNKYGVLGFTPFITCVCIYIYNF